MASAYSVFKLKQDGSEGDAKLEAFRQDLNVRLMCPNCPPDRPVNIVESFSDGDLVCGNCGLVLGDRIVDTRSEWRTFANDEGGDDPSRVGGPSNSLIDGPDDFSTVISFRDNHSGVAKDLQKAARGISSKTGEKHLSAAFAEIQSQCEQIRVPRSVSDLAKQLYKRADEEKVLRGKPMDASAAACIFIACRQARVPRTFKEIVAITKVPKKPVIAAFKILRLKFEGTGVSNLTGEENAANAHLSAGQLTASAEDLINRFGSNLALPHNILYAARDICNKVTNLGILTGRSPITVATCCILFTSQLYGQPKSAVDIAKVGGIAEGTVRMAYRLILPKSAELTSSDVVQEAIKNGKADLSRLSR